jgi:hypothetical protein
MGFPLPGVARMLNVPHIPIGKALLMKKIIASTTIAASLLGGGVAAVVLAPGIAGAQEDVQESEVDSSLADVLDGLVTDGTLTVEQRDSVESALRQARSQFGDRDGIGSRGHGRGFAGGQVLEELGIDRAAVQEGRADGLTLGEIADANGSSAAALTDALVAQMSERLDNALTSGRIDEATAAEKQAEIEQRVDDMVNGEFERPERGQHRGHFGGHGSDDLGTDAADETGAA